jgi:hypothetical protein
MRVIVIICAMLSGCTSISSVSSSGDGGVWVAKNKNILGLIWSHSLELCRVSDGKDTCRVFQPEGVKEVQRVQGPFDGPGSRR